MVKLGVLLLRWVWAWACYVGPFCLLCGLQFCFEIWNEFVIIKI